MLYVLKVEISTKLGREEKMKNEYYTNFLDVLF